MNTTKAELPDTVRLIRRSADIIDLVASDGTLLGELEGTREDEAAELVRRYNAHEALRKTLERISNGYDDAVMREWADETLIGLGLKQ